MASSTDRLIQTETPSSTTVLPQDQTPLAPSCAPEAQPTAHATTSPRSATMSRSASQESLALRCLVPCMTVLKDWVQSVLTYVNRKRSNPECAPLLFTQQIERHRLQKIIEQKQRLQKSSIFANSAKKRQIFHGRPHSRVPMGPQTVDPTREYQATRDLKRMDLSNVLVQECVHYLVMKTVDPTREYQWELKRAGA